MEHEIQASEMPEYGVMTEAGVETNMEAMQQQLNDAEWIRKASETYHASTDYIASSVRSQWEDNLYNFRMEHSPETKAGNRKAKMFRPKIRTALRTHEAALATALFTNNDLVNVEGADKNDPLQQKSASLNKELLQHRLNKTIPWFQTVMGAYQDTHNYGVCISKTYWRYESVPVTELMPITNPDGSFLEDEDGNYVGQEVEVGINVLHDKPVVDLLPPENFRYDPNSDWRNPIEDSPYLIEQMPMFASDVMERMEQVDQKTGQPEWRTYSLSEIITAGTGDLDSSATRQAREGRRIDPQDITTPNKYQTVWIHFNVIRENGVDMAYYTIGTTKLLTKPVPLTEYYKHGRDVYRIGVSTIETHRNYPAGLSELGQNLQNEINTLADQRYENVRLVLNKRYFFKTGSGADVAAVANNVPGGSAFLDDPKNDVHIVSTPDVTSSSYAEQDRLNMDMDELMGTFNQSTVQANRQLNETVGGMNLMSGGANSVQEYVMRTFIESWVEPVLRTLVKLEQYYETDETIIAIAADKAGVKEELLQAAGNPQILDKLIQQDLTVTINVGMGNTNPQQKLQRLMLAINTTAQMPGAAENTNWDEVIKEVYSYAGYGDGGRFLKDENAEQPEQQTPPEVQLKQMELEARKQETQYKEDQTNQRFQMQLEADMQSKHIDAQLQRQKDGDDRELELIKIAEAKGIKLETLRTQLDIESSRDKTKRDIEAFKGNLISRELNFKMTSGRDGI